MTFTLITPQRRPESRGRFSRIDKHTGEAIPSFRAVPEPTLLDTIKDYLNIRQPKTTPLDIEAIENRESPYWIREQVFGTGKVEEMRRIVGKGLSGVTGGISDLVRGYEEDPETVPGTIMGAGAELAGFFLVPYAGAKVLTGTRLAPKIGGLGRVTQQLIQGGATLGIASGVSSILPAFLESESFTEMGMDVLDHTKTGAMIGILFPLSAYVPTKPLRLAVGLAVMDKIRAGVGEWFTIDDVYQGLVDGTIDKKVLAERAFGYLMDMYFILKVPSMGKQLEALKANAMIAEMKGLNPAEIEAALIEIGKQGTMKPKQSDAASQGEIKKVFGSPEEFAKAFKATVPDGGDMAQRVERSFNKGDAELAQLRKRSLKEVMNKVAAATWDISPRVKGGLLKEGGDLGKEAVMRLELRKGAGPKANLILKEANKKIYKDFSKADEIVLNRVLESLRTIEIEKYKPGMKHRGGHSGADFQAYLNALPKETLARGKKRADLIFELFRDQVRQGRKAGIHTAESEKALNKHIYYPRRFIQHLDPERTYNIGGKKITVTDSGIKALDEGSYRAMENNSRLLIAEVVTRSQARIFSNNANRALYEVAKQIPDNPIVRRPKGRPRKPTPLEEILGEEVPETFVRKAVKVPAGHERISVMIEGKRHDMIMPQQFAKEWIVSDPAMSEQLASFIGWASGSKILKPMATGINPEFAVTNLPRDIALVLMSTTEYSPHLPLAVAQMVKDYAEVRSDVIWRKGECIDYIKEGGGMEWLTLQGRAPWLGTKAETVQDYLGYIGETSELWTRVALRHRALKNGKSPHEATWVGRHYLDFAQGGHIIKGLDKGVPYLNASVQGSRAIVRAAKEHPGTFLYKVAQVGIAASGTYLANSLGNPECWDQISASDKARYWIITTPFSIIDEAGNKRWLFGRIAKDQGQRIFATIFESLMAKFMGEEVDVDQVTSAAKDFIPMIPTEMMPPTFDAMMGYYANKDFWRNEDIWKRGVVDASSEWTVYTHPGFIKAGELTGMSPERLKYALQQYFTYGNIYTSAIGGGLSQILEGLPKEEREKTVTEMLVQAPFIRRVLKLTDPFTPFKKPIKEIQKEENTRMWEQIRTLDMMSEKYYKTKTPEGMREIRGYINQQPWQDRNRLLRRVMNYGKLYRIPDRRWWLSLDDMTPESGAVMYWSRWEAAGKEEKARLEKTLRLIPNVTSARFFFKLGQMKKKRRTP